MPGEVPDFLGPLVEVDAPPMVEYRAVVGRPLPVRMPVQALSNWCWAATTEAIEAYYREPAARSQCEVATACLGIQCCPPGQDELTNPRNRQFNLVAAMNRNISGNPVRAPITSAEIQAQIAAEAPMCCAIQWSNGELHFNVIADYRSRTDEVIVRDPKYGDGQIPYDEFRTRYTNDGKWVATLLTRRA